MPPIPPTSPDEAGIVIHEPGSSDSSLADGPGGFDREWFMGRWGVTWSTLPMWKGKKDVVITYTPTSGSGADGYKVFDSSVESLKESASEGSKPSTVRGRETLTPGANGATFDWRGKSYLFFVTSHWEVLGYGKDEANSLEWAVTFFSKTLFTPAGMDIYIRSVPTAQGVASTQARISLRERIVAAIKRQEAGGVGVMAASGFDIPGTV